MTSSKSERYRTIVELIGIITVVGSLLLVAYQIRQSNQIAQGSTTYEIVRDINQFNEMGVTDPDFANFLVILTNEEAKHTNIQALQAQLLAYRFINMWMTQETAYQNDLFTEEQFAISKSDVLNVIETYPGLRPYFAFAMQSIPVSNYDVLIPLANLDSQ